MILYVADISYTYDGTEIIGIYSTAELARAACQNHFDIEASQTLQWLGQEAVEAPYLDVADFAGTSYGVFTTNLDEEMP